MTTYTTITTKSGRILRIVVSPIGVNHGYWADLIARNGRLVAEVGCFGSREQAEIYAREAAARI
jgi:hypothetical protein